jgi:hypothetical protein
MLMLMMLLLFSFVLLLQTIMKHIFSGDVPKELVSGARHYEVALMARAERHFSTLPAAAAWAEAGMAWTRTASFPQHRPSPEDMFRPGSSPETAALRILLYAAAANAKGAPDGPLLASLYLEARDMQEADLLPLCRDYATSANANAAIASFWTPPVSSSTVVNGIRARLTEPQEITLPKEMRLMESVDGHNKERQALIRAEAKKRGLDLNAAPPVKGKKTIKVGDLVLRGLLNLAGYRNVRDVRAMNMVHALNRPNNQADEPDKVPKVNKEWWRLFCGMRESIAEAIWAIADDESGSAGGGGRGGGGGSFFKKQQSKGRGAASGGASSAEPEAKRAKLDGDVICLDKED